MNGQLGMRMWGATFMGALSLLGILSALISCGPEAQGSDGDSPECIAGAGECGGTEICVREQCELIGGQTFFLTVESGDFSNDERYYVDVKRRGGSRLLRTESSAQREDPQWYEETLLTVENRSDYWTLQVWYEGWWGDNRLMSCRLDFEPSLFEEKQPLSCREGAETLDFSLEPMWAQ